MADSTTLRRGARLLWDCFCWIFATYWIAAVRYYFDLNKIQWSSLIAYSVIACLLQAILGTASMLYRGRYRTASFEESLGLAITVLSTSLILALIFIGVVGTHAFPRATALLTPTTALMGMAAGRWVYRAWRGRRQLLGCDDSERVLIYGAGELGHELTRMIAADPARRYRVVGMIDDAPAKRYLRFGGVGVVGGRSDLVAAAIDAGASTVILAINEAGSEMVREVSELARAAGLRFLVLPAVSDLIDGRIDLNAMREVDLTDILGRRQISIDLEEIASYLSGRVVLITGAGGSIGSEIARQVHRFDPSELILLDRDESALHGVQLSIYGKGLLDTPDMALADIRDCAALDQIFSAHRPEVVFHAAALKHLPMLEQYPDEGWKTNAIGTDNVLRIASKYGCRRFVNVSTDKAADPTSVLGMTKRVAERLTAWYAHERGGVYLSVRFGNVLGSRGSVLHTFVSQIHSGGPVTVTDPEVTRYFMTIPEACALTIQAAAVGDPGEVLVLDMGSPIKIVDVAQLLIARSRRKVDIVFTGLREGEKLHEVLFSDDERGTFKHHELIAHVPVPPLDPVDLAAQASSLVAERDPLHAAGAV